MNPKFPHLILANPLKGGDMVTEIKTTPQTPIIYPESDGQ
ncbi:MAG: Uma2 family endonuclease, partial [Limnospira sp. PMC 894.15]|nr:Uma2 family endonuclease [Limnospira sp. PMC 894.15]MDT9233478.1 Uma2 family endonuclease [Limnospira sp. PMC 917.15]MDT9274281.1 Uma2 family endonuclease [Limnospira sp. PMC 737.11]